jgi:hypothetical protein
VLRVLCVVFSGARGEALDERDVDGSDCVGVCLDRGGVCMRRL